MLECRGLEGFFYNFPTDSLRRETYNKNDILFKLALK